MRAAHYVGPTFLALVGLLLVAPLLLVVLLVGIAAAQGATLTFYGEGWWLLPLTFLAGLSCWYGSYRWWRQP